MQCERSGQARQVAASKRIWTNWTKGARVRRLLRVVAQEMLVCPAGQTAWRCVVDSKVVVAEAFVAVAAGDGASGADEVDAVFLAGGGQGAGRDVAAVDELPGG
ncbi:hypothetical protein ABZ612_41205 [Streptomyces avermitilis]|uniref:hypothetical protein n=1 Tax=Streptomyces avermitilis TaxID=33903 RepID=UPI0033D7E793